jgi:hypothetical protein
MSTRTWISGVHGGTSNHVIPHGRLPLYVQIEWQGVREMICVTLIKKNPLHILNFNYYLKTIVFLNFNRYYRPFKISTLRSLTIIYLICIKLIKTILGGSYFAAD